MTIKHLVLSSGSYKGFYMVGALKYLLTNGFIELDNIESIYGTSVGALIGLVLCLKINFHDLVQYIINKPWNKLFNFTIDTAFDFYIKKGFLNVNFIKDILKNLFKEARLSMDATLLDIYNYSNIRLNIFAVNLRKFTIEQFSYKTHPNLSAIKAVYMSCSIPFVFEPEYFNGDCYIDGGLINPYPFDKCINDLSNQNINIEEILGFRLMNDTLADISKKSNVIYFLTYIIEKLLECSINKNDNKLKYELVIPTSIIELDALQNLIINKDARENLIKEGEKYGKLFLNYTP
jgi:hypothetical protein